MHLCLLDLMIHHAPTLAERFRSQNRKQGKVTKKNGKLTVDKQAKDKKKKEEK